MNKGHPNRDIRQALIAISQLYKQISRSNRFPKKQQERIFKKFDSLINDESMYYSRDILGNLKWKDKDV